MLSRLAGQLLKKELVSPLRRWRSRTTAFKDVLHYRLFGDSFLGDPTRNNIDIVINATELRTGSAFRFGSKESGCWRFGKLSDNKIPVAKAVAASAAYPALLPAIDEKHTFVDSKGFEAKKRIILTDGGVYDNLGISCLDPDKSTDYSFNVFKPEYIICCSAGQGIFKDNDSRSFSMSPGNLYGIFYCLCTGVKEGG